MPPPRHRYVCLSVNISLREPHTYTYFTRGQCTWPCVPRAPSFSSLCAAGVVRGGLDCSLRAPPGRGCRTGCCGVSQEARGRTSAGRTPRGGVPGSQCPRQPVSARSVPGTGTAPARWGGLTAAQPRQARGNRPFPLSACTGGLVIESWF